MHLKDSEVSKEKFIEILKFGRKIIHLLALFKKSFCFPFPITPGPNTGVKIFEKITVEKVVTKNGMVTDVVTSAGTIKCDFFVNCAGQVCGCVVPHFIIFFL